ncbi:hypothetical protein G6F70_002951 [Rhizopus microsporus]|uniref:Bms1-type G domain-containing protein n=2 Tax=Rhizopus TaxID=4842 RepID=A0A367JHG9_RHIAZ|nr:hypothetical protein G6F71_000131 [Rhizopus microsporus]RCH89319.1 hypothetical protein CU097_006136 [Rhizopus azygosporus]KAG1201659.1 hypothetical protein G6F70_002951 [Rhizopus microsporus]KAG1213661.1 hypothetical protein G6F69_002626 [Rhizopus microsporus]KAG1238451.1 hypothetical protein G6F67_000435 [Rhizopus microsporus]
MHRHRPGSLHQSNKPFKSRHATKGALKEASKGKVNRASIKQSGGMKTLSKADRRHAAKILQQKKREEITRMSRIFEGRQGAPKIVPVLPLCPDSEVHTAIAALYKSLGQEAPKHASEEPTVLNVERFKQKIQLVPLTKRRFLDILDAFKVADFGILLMSADVEVDQLGINCLLGILNQGIVNVVPVVQHIERVQPKLRTSTKKSLTSFIQQFFPEEEHLFTLDTDTDAMNTLRFITSQRPKPMSWRDHHPYMLADEVTFDSVTPERGTLKVTGYARGNPFNANRLVHLQNFGDFQIQQITSAPLESHQGDMEVDAAVIDTPKPDEQDDLIAENEPDFMDNEQTWPTEEELAEADERVRRMQAMETDGNTKRVPKGTSSYQAAWIVDDDDQNYSEDEFEDENENDAMMTEDADDDIVEPAYSSFPPEEEYEEIQMDSKEQYKDELDAEEEARQYEEYLKQRQKDYETHNEFPDEIDTPMHIPARERFARYRGLQSFRTSPWDPYENLPVDYARIFQFENYGRTKSRVLNQAIVGNVKPGSRITIWIHNVPIEAFQSYDRTRPFIVFGLLQYEHKMSLLNIQIQRDNAYEEPVKSKDPMVMHMGFRRYNVRPIYSQNTNKGSNNVHKFERFIQLGRSYVATVYGPIVFGKTPVMFYKETENKNEPILVSTGTFMDVDVKRIIAKRIILSGHPFKIHKRSAVVRYMFFNVEDIYWFKPVQLTTKYGRVGHIKESLGTHGYMKCVFDGTLTQQDTVMMCLYKRVFPKWNTELYRDESSQIDCN